MRQHEMTYSIHLRTSALWVAIIAALLFLSGAARAGAQTARSETTTAIIVVKDYDSGDPISQAHLTLQFYEPGGAARLNTTKKHAYSGKTDTQGRYKFIEINKGTIVLTVTAPGHQTYGRELQLEHDNQVFEIKLKKPQPLV